MLNAVDRALNFQRNKKPQASPVWSSFLNDSSLHSWISWHAWYLVTLILIPSVACIMPFLIPVYLLIV